MPQSKDKNKPGQYNPEKFRTLLTLLESPDPDAAESVKNMIQDTLSNSKDSKYLHHLIDFYVATESKNSLEILLHVKEPHDKHVFEKVNEMMKNESSRYYALQILGNIVYKQPSWLHKISSQRLMHTLLNMLKTDMNPTNLLSGLFILICLLPLIPYQFGSSLPDTFNIFSRLAAWDVKKPSSLSDILNLYLQTGVYSLFHRLYGMYPCNFLAYLRSFYGNRDCTEENFKVFSQVIKPMLERVRLHPLLVTASKEAELNVNRWKKMAYHDIIVECASISLDSVEGSSENNRISTQSEKISSFEKIRLSCLNSAVVDPCSVLSENVLCFQEPIWSPSQIVDTTALSSNNLSLPQSSKGYNSEWNFKNAMQSSTEDSIPLDFAVEAKPELLKSELEISGKNSSMDEKEISKPFDLEEKEVNRHTSPIKQVPNQNSTDSDSLVINSGKYVSTIENKEDDIDKEVSDLTSSQTTEQTLIPDDMRQDTPFCSTTQNLTDEPVNLNQIVASLPVRSDSLTKSTEEDTEETYNSLQDSDLQSRSYVPSFSRYRYFSHCGPAPDLVPVIKKPTAFRSISCPAELCPLTSSLTPELKNCCPENFQKTNATVMTHSSNTATTSAFVPLINENSVAMTAPLSIYEQLLPAVVNPLKCFEEPIVIGMQRLVPKNLSPPELLDLYILYGNNYYLNNLPLTSSKDTDWTHFGGKPPSDEIEVLRNQILLLHNMLLFERHRKDIHSERNRRYLGRAKRVKMQEEYVEALKTEIGILTEENDNLKTELSKQHKIYQILQQRRKKTEIELDSKLFKLGQENTQLLFSNKQLQTLLVSQKEENDEIRDLYKKAERDIENMKNQLQYAKGEVQLCQKVKKEAIFLTKQLILLQELNVHYKSKIEQLKEPRQPNIKHKIMNNSMSAEITDLKQKLETKTILLDACEGKLSKLESMLSTMKSKQKEKTSSCEKMRIFHHEEIMVREERIADLQKISLEKDAHLLKLYSDIDELLGKIGVLEKNSVDHNGLKTASLTVCSKNSNCQKLNDSLS